ncbi:MAG TPA: AbrB/MazE/SpoVT family DNA-binding domain-containing protein [Thermoanaerobaculia bacterium]|jgi:AbrB family looped-hinge helix DNA binding protein|nr:AbrB/MazE/SpoVT family DNA-binding domain-containing protein [Thermoanaerobaculia bacterium]
MSISRVTSKGQVTIPSEVRKALDIEKGDDLLFEVSSDRVAHLRVVKRRRLSDLYGALPATRPYPGKEKIRKETGKALGKQMEKKGR